MRGITLTITEKEYLALKAKAMKELFADSDELVKIVARQAMVSELITARYITFEEVYAAMATENRPVETPNKTAEPIPAVKNTEKTPNGLPVPQETYGGRPSNTYIVWKAIIAIQMDQKQWMSYHTTDIQAILHNLYGTNMNIKVTNSSLNSLVLSAWLYKTKNEDKPGDKKTNLYRFTSLARDWLKKPSNQDWLIRENIIRAAPDLNEFKDG